MTPTARPAPRWGGKRPGAGRPARETPLRNISVSLPQALIEAVDRQADLQRTSRSAIIEHALRLGLHLEPAYRSNLPRETRSTTGTKKNS